MEIRIKNIPWAIRMLFMWRWRCGYWALDAFQSALRISRKRKQPAKSDNNGL